MAVKVIIVRRYSAEVGQKILPLLTQLHQLANESNGYISGEAFGSTSDPDGHLVISSWETTEDWEAFINSEKSQDLHQQVDSYLDTDTMYQVYKKH